MRRFFTRALTLSKVSKVSLASLASVALLLAMTTPASAAQAAVHQWWSYSSDGMYNLDTNVTVQRTGPTRFFAHQFGFAGGDGAYMGIQDTPGGRLAIFSVWNSPGNAVPGPGAECEPFGGEGVGHHCLLPYDWQLNTSYRLRVWQVDARDDGSTRWVAAIRNNETGKESVIGYLWTQPGQRLLSNSSAVWIEYYGGGNCADQVPAKAVFSYPTGNAGQIQAAKGYSNTTTCGDHQSSITDNGDGTVTISE